MTLPELSDAWLAAWPHGDEERFAELCTPTVHYEDPLTPPLRGAAAIADHARHLRRGLPDLRLRPAGTAPRVGRFLALPWQLRATHTGPLGGLPPTGRTVDLHGVFYCELDGPDGTAGRLLKVRAFFDLYDAGAQLGVLPARGTLGGRALLALRGFGLRLGR